jgi:alcohol dehydrogenase
VRAAQYGEVGGEVRIIEVDDPACPPDGVVLAVRATGICRSDWHAWRGHDPVTLPHVGGHEYAGGIVEIGPGVRDIAVGDRVTVPFVCGCGRCEYCRSGNAQVCPDQQQPGFTMPGSFAEYVAVPAADANVVQLPDQVGFTEAAALGCRFATAFRAVTVHGGVQPGWWVAVHGCGGVGLSAIMIARALGARVVAVDVSADALARAAALGAEQVVDGGATPDVAEVVQQLTGGAHVSLDALGSPVTAVNSVRSLRRRGRHVQAGLLLGEAAHPPIPMDRVLGWELEIHGSHGMPAVDYPAMLAMVTDGRLRPAELVTRTIALDGIGAVLAAMDSPSAGPGIVVAVP